MNVPQSIKNFDPDTAKGWRRDWLEVYGNLWGSREHKPAPMSPEEKRALETALNPFSDRRCYTDDELQAAKVKAIAWAINGNAR